MISFRPEFVPPWFGRAGVSLVMLTRLDRRQSAALAAQVTGAHPLTTVLLERIIAQTDGVPLFIEELTKAMLETAADHYPLALTVPTTLQASLMARLDRLPAAKQVAQIGAVIGREFPYNLLVATAGLSEAQLATGLDELTAAGLVFRRGLQPEAVYTFKHALVQDTAYQSLIKTQFNDPIGRSPDGARSTPGTGRRGARNRCPSFHPGRPASTSGGMVGQGGRTGLAAARLRRSTGAPRTSTSTG